MRTIVLCNLWFPYVCLFTILVRYHLITVYLDLNFRFVHPNRTQFSVLNCFSCDLTSLWFRQIHTAPYIITWRTWISNTCTLITIYSNRAVKLHLHKFKYQRISIQWDIAIIQTMIVIRFLMCTLRKVYNENSCIISTLRAISLEKITIVVNWIYG